MIESGDYVIVVSNPKNLENPDKVPIGIVLETEAVAHPDGESFIATKPDERIPESYLQRRVWLYSLLNEEPVRAFSEGHYKVLKSRSELWWA